MTNLEHLQRLNVEEFAEWLCSQLWDGWTHKTVTDVIRYNAIRNYLMNEYDPEV